jgi:CRISPR/Cas system-associated exonuclease Cas4 (RecB family)
VICTATLGSYLGYRRRVGRGNCICGEVPTLPRKHCIQIGGTADVIGISKEKRKLIIADLKTGRGYVDAESDQLKLYALAAMEEFNLYQDIDKVELWIIQPHHGEVRKHTMTTQELVDWEHYILQPAIENALNPAYPPVPSDSACQYCAGKTICPAQANMVEVVHSAPPVEV